MEGTSAMKTLPDYLPVERGFVSVGCNPSLTAARRGFYYSGRGNQFWSLSTIAGLCQGVWSLVKAGG